MVISFVLWNEFSSALGSGSESYAVQASTNSPPNTISVYFATDLEAAPPAVLSSLGVFFEEESRGTAWHLFVINVSMCATPPMGMGQGLWV